MLDVFFLLHFFFLNSPPLVLGKQAGSLLLMLLISCWKSWKGQASEIVEVKQFHFFTEGYFEIPLDGIGPIWRFLQWFLFRNLKPESIFVKAVVCTAVDL